MMHSDYKRVNTINTIATVEEVIYASVEETRLKIQIQNYLIKDSKNICELLVRDNAFDFEKGEKYEFVIHIYKSDYHDKPYLICYKLRLLTN